MRQVSVRFLTPSRLHMTWTQHWLARFISSNEQPAADQLFLWGSRTCSVFRDDVLLTQQSQSLQPAGRLLGLFLFELAGVMPPRIHLCTNQRAAVLQVSGNRWLIKQWKRRTTGQVYFCRLLYWSLTDMWMIKEAANDEFTWSETFLFI